MRDLQYYDYPWLRCFKLTWLSTAKYPRGISGLKIQWTGRRRCHVYMWDATREWHATKTGKILIAMFLNTLIMGSIVTQCYYSSCDHQIGIIEFKKSGMPRSNFPFLRGKVEQCIDLISEWQEVVKCKCR